MDLTPGALQRVAEDWVFRQHERSPILTIHTIVIVIGTDLLDYIPRSITMKARLWNDLQCWQGCPARKRIGSHTADSHN